VDFVALTASVLAVCCAVAGWRMRRRALRAAAEAARLREELVAERHAAAHDPLTGLPNRRAFYQLGAALVADPTRQPLVAVVLDLDDFKQINDRLGHAAGDEVLVTVARRFAAYAGDNLVARLGGDEFAGLLTVPDLDDAWLNCAARELADALAAPMQAIGYSVTLTASVGLVPVDGHVDLAEALRRADAAMYRAKSGGYGVSTGPLRHPQVWAAAGQADHAGAHLPGWFGRHHTTPRQRAGTARGSEFASEPTLRERRVPPVTAAGRSVSEFASEPSLRERRVPPASAAGRAVTEGGGR
jgi:diguanylate cyclase (GGDEF)-like protein